MMTEKQMLEPKLNSAEKAATTSVSPACTKRVVSRSQFKPMLFYTPMVEAILDGRKTMTRRIVKAGFDLSNMFYRGTVEYISELGNQEYFSEEPNNGEWLGTKRPIEIGNIIWVRETFYAYGNWIKAGTNRNGKQKYKFIDFTKDKFSFQDFSYKYEDCKPQRIKSSKQDGIGWYKRPSLFMPKNACRLFLEVIDIKVERIQNISNEDAVNEGIEIGYCDSNDNDKTLVTYKNYVTNRHDLIPASLSFHTLWESINGYKSWNENSFVWVYTFKRVECPQGFC
jgi:hypothetical protein